MKCKECGTDKVYAKELCKRCYSRHYQRNYKPKKPIKGRVEFGLQEDDIGVLKDLAKEYEASTYHIMARVILEKVLYKMPYKDFKKLMEEKQC